MEDGLTHLLKVDETCKNEWQYQMTAANNDLHYFKKKIMKTFILGFFLLLAATQSSSAQSTTDSASKRNYTKAEQAIVELSKMKWQWMADKNVDKLAPLFHDKSKFVHMSGTWKKTEELDIIKTGSIWYKKADLHDVLVEIVDDVAIAWSRITLTAEVRGNDAVTQFTVTEVYKKQGGDWKLLALTFSSVRNTHQIKH
jgi:Domain of unknown function (DUF4440)